MRLLADENVPRAVIAELRARGADVSAVGEIMAGATDAAVLAHALAQQRVLLTFDKDFGELAARTGGVVLGRLSAPPARLAVLVADALAADLPWTSSFVVIEPGRIRQRPLP
jgi:hypothetical protein